MQSQVQHRRAHAAALGTRSEERRAAAAQPVGVDQPPARGAHGSLVGSSPRSSSSSCRPRPSPRTSLPPSRFRGRRHRVLGLVAHPVGVDVRLELRRPSAAPCRCRRPSRTGCTAPEDWTAPSGFGRSFTPSRLAVRNMNPTESPRSIGRCRSSTRVKSPVSAIGADRRRSGHAIASGRRIAIRGASVPATASR